MHDERVRAVQQDVISVTRIKCHQCFATIKLLWPSGENISKLEDRVVGNGIEIMIAIDTTGQTPLDYVEERIKRREGFVLWIGHDWFPFSRAHCAGAHKILSLMNSPFGEMTDALRCPPPPAIGGCPG